MHWSLFQLCPDKNGSYSIRAASEARGAAVIPCTGWELMMLKNRSDHTHTRDTKNPIILHELVLRNEVKERHICLSTNVTHQEQKTLWLTIYFLSFPREGEPQWNLTAAAETKLDFKNFLLSFTVALSLSNRDPSGYNGWSFEFFEFCFQPSFYWCLKNSNNRIYPFFVFIPGKNFRTVTTRTCLVSKTSSPSCT